MNNQDEKEQAISGFYNANFTWFDTELKSAVISRQVQAAFDLLAIDPELFINESTEVEKEQLLKEKFKRAILAFHPDKLTTLKQDDSKQKAKALFNLVMLANKLLKEIIKTPALLDEKLLFEQESYVPQYQYELSAGFVDDPYYYIRMASSATEYRLYQNWVYDYEPDNLAASSNETALQIYRPKLTVFNEGNRRLITMKGCEAFYHLFLAGALPRRFDQGHFSMIFDRTGTTSAQHWLLVKALESPVFVDFMDTNELVRFARTATRMNLVSIGNSVNDIFEYYYLHFPESLYHRRLEKLTEDDAFDSERMTDFILSHPHQLTRLQGRIDPLVKLSPALLNYALANKNTTRALSSGFIRQNLFESLVRKNGQLDYKGAYMSIQDLPHLALFESVYDNTTFLSWLSLEALGDLRRYVLENSHCLPVWLVDMIDEDLSLREQPGHALILQKNKTRIQASEDNPFSNKRVNPQKFLIKSFLKAMNERSELIDARITNYLSSDALSELANSRLIHWSCYLPIAAALIKQKEPLAARSYLLAMAENLQMDAGEHSVEMLYELLNARQSEIHAIYNLWRQDYNAQILTEYQALLEEGSAEQFKAIDEQLDLLDLSEAQAGLNKAYLRKQKDVYWGLVDRLYAGELSEGLKSEFFALRSTIEGRYSQLRKDWLDFSVLDRKGKAVDDFLKSTLYKMIGLNDRNDLSGKTLCINDYQWSDEAGFLTNLERLYFIYGCLRTTDDFYSDFSDLASLTHSALAKLTSFDGAALIHHLNQFIDIELSVCIQGKREKAGYKNPVQHISDFPGLYSLFQKLNRLPDLEARMPAAYAMLVDEFNKLRSHRERETARALSVYIDIRGSGVALTQPLLEEQAINRQVKALLDRFIDWNQSLLRRDIDFLMLKPNLMAPGPGQSSTLSTPTSELLTLLAKYIEASPKSSQMLEALEKDPILRHYQFALVEVKCWFRNTTQITWAMPKPASALIDYNPNPGASSSGSILFQRPGLSIFSVIEDKPKKDDGLNPDSGFNP